MQHQITNPLPPHATLCRFLRSNEALVTEHLFYVHQFKLADPAAFTAAEDVHAIGEALLKNWLPCGLSFMTRRCRGQHPIVRMARAAWRWLHGRCVCV